MGKKIRVTPEELKNASEKLANHSETYKRIHTELMQVASTMGQAWEGADNIEFVRQIEGFGEDLRLMTEKLLRASEALKLQRDNYANHQEGLIAQVKQLKN